MKLSLLSSLFWIVPYKAFSKYSKRSSKSVAPQLPPMALIKAFTPSKLFTFSLEGLILDTVANAEPSTRSAARGANRFRCSAGHIIAKNSIFLTYSCALVVPGWKLSNCRPWQFGSRSHRPVGFIRNWRKGLLNPMRHCCPGSPALSLLRQRSSWPRYQRERQSTLQHWQRAVSPTVTKWLTTKSKGLYQVHLMDIDDGKGSQPMEI